MSKRQQAAVAAGKLGLTRLGARGLLALALLFGVGAPARAHFCGPGVVTITAGETVDWVIIADLDEDFTFYEIVKPADPAVVTVAPSEPFEAHDGAYTITGVAPGQTFLVVSWFYEPTDIFSECFVTIVVEEQAGCFENQDCDDGNLCTNDLCDRQTGSCSNPSVIPVEFCCNPQDGSLALVDDQNECTDDTCDEATGSVDHAPVPSGVVCAEDGDSCTDDVCVGGVCAHEPNDLCGACCAGIEGCFDTTRGLCADIGGILLEPSFGCGEPQACCLHSDACAMLDVNCCLVFGGTPLGEDVLCEELPPGCCAEDVDLDEDGFTRCCGDCNDNDHSTHVGAPESCNGRDDNCNGLVDEGFDVDADGYTVCAGDCDDGNELIYPDAEEVCNGVDDDCDGAVDDGFDVDDDGFTSCGGDCDDDEEDVHPNAKEICDGIDNDCNELIDEGFNVDRDGYTTCAGDCDDLRPSVYPGAPEVCGNKRDDDCDGAIDASDPDCQRVSELCDGFDNDNDGSIDEDFTLYGVNQETQVAGPLSIGAVCTVGAGLCETVGKVACGSAGLSAICTATSGVPETEGPAGDTTCFDFLDNDCDGLDDHEDPDCTSAERCDTFDNDGDGLIDEDFPGLGGFCTVGAGICEKRGFVECNEDGTGTSCSATPGAPGVESPPGSRNCTDGVDNDCDELTDLDDPDCRSGERCDGIDNDGDWCVDEDFPSLGADCEVGLGQCHAEGVYVCRADGSDVACSAVPGMPAPEGPSGCTCYDQVDNDCDGLTDDDDPDCFSEWIADTVWCKLVPRRARPTDRCGGVYEITFGSTTEDAKLSADLLALDKEGDLLGEVPVDNGSVAYLASKTDARSTRPVGTIPLVGRAFHWSIGPAPMLRVTIDDGYNRGHAYCSIIPHLDMIEPDNTVVSESEGDQTPVTVSMPFVDPESLSIKVDGVDVLAALGIDLGSGVPKLPVNGSFTIPSHGLTPTRVVEVCGLTIRPGSAENSGANTLSMTLNNMGCGGHIIVVEGEPLLKVPKAKAKQGCYEDDIRDIGVSQGLAIDVTAPLDGSSTIGETVTVAGLTCHGRPLESVRIAGEDIPVDTQEFIAGDGADSADTWRLPFSVDIPVNDLRAELDTGNADPGAVDPWSNRLFLQSSDADFHTTFDQIFFAVDPVIPSATVARFRNDLAEAVAGVVSTEVTNAYTFTMDGPAMSRFFDEVCGTLGPRLAQRIEDRLRGFTSRRSRINLPFPFCDPKVSLSITEIDLDASQFTCSFTPEHGRVRMRFTLPDFEVATSIGGGCKTKVLGICLVKIAIGIDSDWKIPGIEIGFDITEDSIVNQDNLDLNFNFGGEPLVIEASIQNRSRVGCIVGWLINALQFVARIGGSWDRAEADLRFELAGDELRERIGELDGDLRDISVFKFDNDQLVPQFMLKLTRRLSEVEITPEYIAAGVTATFAPTSIDPRAVKAPGTPLTPAPLPVPPIAGGDEVTIAISDDVINQLMGSLAQTGKLATVFEDKRLLGDFLPDAAHCATLGPVRGPRCVGLIDGDCSQFDDVGQRLRCAATKLRWRRRNIGPDTSIILSARVDVPPKLLIDDDDQTPAVEVAIRNSQLAVSIVADRDGGGVTGGAISELLPCFGANKATEPECVLWGACLNVNVSANVSLQAGQRLGLQLNVTDVDHDLSLGAICRGGVQDEGNSMILEAARGETMDLLNRRLRESAPPLEATDLDFGGLLRFDDVRLIAIENNGDTNFDDYIAITGKLIVNAP